MLLIYEETMIFRNVSNILSSINTGKILINYNSDL